jgi:hypothetical protein
VPPRMIRSKFICRHPVSESPDHRGAKDRLPQPFVSVVAKGSIRVQLAL